MLRGIRTATSNWIGKIVMGVVVAFLVVSFAIWGIGDIFSGFGQSKVASIGNVEISIEQFRQIYNDRLQQLGRQLRRPLSSEQARALGLDRQVLAQMLAEAALDERARQMGLGITDAWVARQITEEPAFRGINGEFSRAQFERAIRDAGYTEPRFVAEQRRVTVRRQLANTISGELTIPKSLLSAFDRYQNEQRSIEYVVLDRNQAGEIPTPTPEQLAKYFEEHRIEFRAPEYRKVELLALTPADLGKWKPIDEADLRKAYEHNRARYVTPERRHVRQIVFPNEADARAAADRIAAGTTFDAIAAERKLKEQDIDLGVVTRAAIIDKAVADAAFALKANEVSAPVKGRFGTALVQTLSTEPEKVRPFEEVAAELRQEMAAERGKDELSHVRDKIEDERAAGSTLAEAAKKLNLSSRTVEMDRSGRAPDGSLVQLPPGLQGLPAAFSTGVGVEADPIQFGDSGLLYFDVVGITPSRERNLDEVKKQVEDRWRDDQIAARLKTQATEMIDKVKAGGKLAELAQAKGLKVQTASSLTRLRPTEDVPAPVLAAVFRTPKDEIGTAEPDPTRQVVFQVTGITVPPVDATSPDGKQMVETLQRSIADAMLGEYLARIEKDIGASINQSALNQATGATALR
jgi:peptidyl-prolyl cis-trans isomerase D